MLKAMLSVLVVLVAPLIAANRSPDPHSGY